MELLLSGDFPWARLRQAQKLLRLPEKYGKDRVENACRRALSFDLIDVRRVEGMITKGLEGTEGASRGKVIAPSRFEALAVPDQDPFWPAFFKGLEKI